MTPLTYVIKFRDGRYLYAGLSPTHETLLTRNQKHARRFDTRIEAWRWVVEKAYWPRSGRTPTSAYTVVRLTPRCCCRCER